MRKFLLGTLLLTATLSAKAGDGKWILITNSNQSAALENVSYLLAADNDTQFSIILKEGEPISGVESISFKETGTDGISTIKATQQPKMVVANGTLSLSLIDSNTDVAIYDLAGSPQPAKVSRGNGITIDISSLPEGIYILKTGKQQLKFIKR
ncbi:MAG: T9SS type A sorting domain-containing protein [Prevotella sp.]|nr:T9SS type A sorting domain-containing protein [Prevotella sp.]